MTILKHDQTSLIKIIRPYPGHSLDMLILADVPPQPDSVRLDMFDIGYTLDNLQNMWHNTHRQRHRWYTHSFRHTKGKRLLFIVENIA